MAILRTIPDPTYERELSVIAAVFKRGIRDIQSELYRLDLSALSRAQANAALREIAKILASIDAKSAAWVAENIPKAATEGVARTLYALELTETYEQATKIAKFSRLNADYVKAAVADTQADLLAITRNIDSRTRKAVQQAVSDSMRANLAKGVNGRRTIQRDVLANMRQQLGTALDTGIIDAGGRRWKPEVYAETVTRTKMQRTHLEATENEALSRGVQYGIISRHGATDACRAYEGRVVKLTPDAPGSYPYVGDLKKGREIFHPLCRHQVTPVRNPEIYGQ
ncbi:phage minor capsid protein [Paenibacillus sp. YN15]|uniref:phage minor capsid protein n=1 Tax=Paenibacillus sp. YN15 TaxID=1742774 RepID=UPI000DCD771F|nr:phage minor capsid protein [Paenibacillus sp. YN15]RAU96832.1 minor capsid protein [Paenibacillus sp. YN15]